MVRFWIYSGDKDNKIYQVTSPSTSASVHSKAERSLITAHPHYLWILHLFARLSVTPKPIQRCSPGHCGYTQSHGNICCLVQIFPVEVKQGATLPSCFSSHCKTGLLAFYFVLCFLNSCAFHWFHFLKCPLSVCWLVFLSIRRLWCALWRKCVR